MLDEHTEILFKKYELIIKLYNSATDKYWKIYSIFLVIMGLLFAGFSQVIEFGIEIVTMYCIIGIVISFIWMPVIRRNIVHAEICEDLGRNIEKNLRCITKEKIPKINQNLSVVRKRDSFFADTRAHQGAVDRGQLYSN